MPKKTMLRIEDLLLRYGTGGKKVSRATWSRWDRNGEVPPSFMVGGVRFFDPDDVTAWEEKRKTRTAS
ncbi:hypothetical protein KIH74_23050 [Kineosporia sp. J2-2]|uniref:Helix-turn-helix domain-containing protein n=1 Tax=Kineosporia corallincola TaxID=2835133 RepID=A0ABS5TP54_9ACTN|nr:hypothetical protein [Kineosporia corallincola]MBT0771838.1 hypothetical protein [Kineosporia corallincola]